MSNPREKLILMLETMFEVDKADLDFGIYRIMNQKRSQVSEFIRGELLESIGSAVDANIQEERESLNHRLSRAIDEAKAFGITDPDGTPPVQELRKQIEEIDNEHKVEGEVFSHLYSFFRRYFHKGDFISQRRYGKDKYAIPYTGEEVRLHWANFDQHYVKTSKYFKSYTFTVGEKGQYRINFVLTSADQEKDNIKPGKGQEWRTMICDHDPLTAKQHVLDIRVMGAITDDSQSTLNETFVKTVRRLLKGSPWLNRLDEKASTETSPNRSLLEVHLDRYTSRNTRDFFIHKDLKGFLERELDFYIKSEMIDLASMTPADSATTLRQLQRAHAVRNIAHKIIRMLAHIENFQQRLWTKQKFVIDSHYLVSLDKVPVTLHQQIAESKPQWDAWVALGLVSRSDVSTVNKRKVTLRDQPRLMVDTALFDTEFRVTLMQSIDNLDQETNGLLIHAENYQAIQLISRRYGKRVKCIYIDPPYNTSEETFLYKNQYQHSSWMSMMADRVSASWELLATDGVLVVAIDDKELYHLKLLLDAVIGSDHYVATIAVETNPGGRSDSKFYATSHDYYLVYARSLRDTTIADLPLSDKDKDKYNKSDAIGHYCAQSLVRSGNNSEPSDRPNMEFAIYYSPSKSTIVGIGGKRKARKVSAPYKPKSIYRIDWAQKTMAEVTPEAFDNRSPKDTITILPEDTHGRRRIWRIGDREQLLCKILRGEVFVSNNAVKMKKYTPGGKKAKTLWSDKRYAAAQHGTGLLNHLFGDRQIFTYPKSLYSTLDILHTIVGEDKDALVLDFFAGSGTTGHAVNELNRQDGGNRKYVLVEMGQYFDTVLKARMQKVLFASEWKNGKPIRTDTGPGHIIKYLTLESYEDTLNNLVLDDGREDRRKLLSDNTQFRIDYNIGYWLDIETQNSMSLLNIEAFRDPFNYRLMVGIGTVGAIQPVEVDLVETFNYLIGLTVNRQIQVNDALSIVTGTNCLGESVAVMWRNVEKMNNVAFDAFLNGGGGGEYLPKSTHFDKIYLNGDHALDDPTGRVTQIELLFKEAMFSTIPSSQPCES